MTAGFICLLTPDLLVQDGFDPCLNCGGSATLGRPQEAVVSDRGRFCSEDCAAEAEEFAQQAKASDWCPSCGFDRFEHADDCPTKEGHEANPH